MNKKVGFLDWKIRQLFTNIIAAFATAATLFSLFFSIPNDYKLPLAILFLTVLILIYISIWYWANKKQSARLRINETNVNIIVGDIFEQDGWKVIGVNDFMDTIADDKIIAKKTLHGLFLKRFKEKIPELNRQIEENDKITKFVVERDIERSPGKSIRYQLGTVFAFEDYILTAFGKVEEDNMVCLDAESYIKFWMNFWKNVDAVYAGNKISIPLMGSGITRFRDGKLSKQRLLETMLWTMKISNFQCTYRDASVNFIIHESDKDEINFFQIGKYLFE